MKKILDTIFSDNGEFVVRFLFAVIFMIFFTSNLFGQMNETDTDITRQEIKEHQQRQEESILKQQHRNRQHRIDEQLLRMKMMDEKKKGQQQIQRIILEKEKKRKFMKRKIRRERIRSFILGIGIGYAIGDSK